MFRRRHPAQLVVIAFAFAVAFGTLLLWLPIAREGAAPTPLLTALFTATSAVCVTGLQVVDTASHWSPFGEGVILFLIQIGGFGIMTLASLLALFVYRDLGVRGKILAQAETKAMSLGDVRRVLLGVALFSLVLEAVTAALLTVRLAVTHGQPLGRAVYHGVFHSISAFNNAGFSLYRDNLIGFASDGWFLLTIGAAIVLGGLGFPVLMELWSERRQRSSWSLHTRLTLIMTAVLLLGGTLVVLASEWSNPDTLGALSMPGKFLGGFFQGLSPRTAGFNSLDYAEMRETTWLGTILLMFIGGGSASTAGGVKVTTIALLAGMVFAEARGEEHVNMMGRRIPGAAQRQALSIVLLGLFVVICGTMVVMSSSGQGLARSVFETVSAFGTVGLTTGITSDLPVVAKLTLVALMFIGRVGPITLGAALAMRQHRRLYQLPEERPIVG